MNEHSESLRMLRKTIGEEKMDPLILRLGGGWGDILLVKYIQLEPRHRGYGIGLLAVKMFMDHVAAASDGWADEGILVVDASGLDSDLELAHNRREVQKKKLIRHWQLIGLKPIVSEFERKKGKHCTFVGNWQDLYGFPDDMATLVPHLFTASCDTANVRLTAPKRRNGLEELYAFANSASVRSPGLEELEKVLGIVPARKRARVH